ncbi:class E sortase [Streptomyces exfoliatus]|uniref:Class E sortase n=1 Tax=Streptomyces exfoliatus TaxID=1905 RepID=A0ABV3D4N2_STREX
MGANRRGPLRRGRSGVRGVRAVVAAAVAAVITVVAVAVGVALRGADAGGTPAGVRGADGTTAAVRGAQVTPAGVHGADATSAGVHGPSAAPPPPSPSAPTPRPTASPVAAEVSIPSIGVEALDVVPYEGTTDDRAGTRIQDRGVAASPYGEHGGVGPGDVGNYLVTAHRLSAGGPLRDLPAVDVGDLVRVTAGGTVYTYEIVETRETSFRSVRSLAEQRAAVPGDPGQKPTRAMITLSTCATPEDDAAGNFWRDAQGNPEHRIDKIGVLTSKRPA